MKFIPKDELIAILNGLKEHNTISIELIGSIFEIYGDDYYKDYGMSPWILTKENQKRKELFMEDKE